jgi:hypothetical protein
LTLAATPADIKEVTPVFPTLPDHAFLLAASWEERCLGATRKLGHYECRRVILSVYDGPSDLRAKHLVELHDRLARVAPVTRIDVRRADPIPAVRQTLAAISELDHSSPPRLTIDVSTFTRKHLLQLLQGLDLEGYLAHCHLLHTEPLDYPTQDNEPVGLGISSVRAIETLAGRNTPSRESLLILFLGYEGRRALALWEHLEPHVTVVVIPDPPYRENWVGRTEAQNRYLLSCVSKDRVFRSHSLVPAATEQLLHDLVHGGTYGAERYNYLVAPLGTKAQTVGAYRFLRRHPGLATVMYARPIRYREHLATFPPGRTWLIDQTSTWS